MNRLFRVLHRWKCKTAAHKLALDALGQLGPERRADLFLWQVETYLRGVDAPEAEFRDFTNHVLYPVERWGGAGRLAQKWYGKTVETLRTQDWAEAIYAAGVMTRYVTFAFQPARTGHDETGLAIRRPVEWCQSRLYDELVAEAASPKAVTIPAGSDWVERLVGAGAEEAHCQLRAVTKGFELKTVMARPGALDEELREIFGTLLLRSSATAGSILARAIDESGCTLPRRMTGTAGLLSLPALPLFWVTRGSARRADRRDIRLMRKEFLKTGAIDETLPEEVVAVRDAFEVEVLKKAPRKVETPVVKAAAPAAASKSVVSPKTTPAAPKAAAARPERSIPPVLSAGAGQPARSSNEPKLADSAAKPVAAPPLPALAAAPDPVVREKPREATGPLGTGSPLGSLPWIEAKLLSRLESAGIRTIGQLTSANSGKIASILQPQVNVADVTAWQDQARLVCAVSVLSPEEAQLLVACGVTGPDDLAALSPIELWELVIPVAESPDGRRLLRGGAVPDLNAVTRWIDAAQRPRKAA